MMTVCQQLYDALTQLLDEVIAEGLETAEDYNWPRSIADARAAIARYHAHSANRDPAGAEKVNCPAVGAAGVPSDSDGG
jgi:hypothetical protein